MVGPWFARLILPSSILWHGLASHGLDTDSELHDFTAQQRIHTPHSACTSVSLPKAGPHLAIELVGQHPLQHPSAAPTEDTRDKTPEKTPEKDGTHRIACQTACRDRHSKSPDLYHQSHGQMDQIITPPPLPIASIPGTSVVRCLIILRRCESCLSRSPTTSGNRLQCFDAATSGTPVTCACIGLSRLPRAASIPGGRSSQATSAAPRITLPFARRGPTSRIDRETHHFKACRADFDVQPSRGDQVSVGKSAHPHLHLLRMSHRRRCRPCLSHCGHRKKTVVTCPSPPAKRPGSWDSVSLQCRQWSNCRPHLGSSSPKCFTATFQHCQCSGENWPLFTMINSPQAPNLLLIIHIPCPSHAKHLEV
ncbi:hypothetical protein T440DRAFT_474180 [Plenodomus tracheiphilus IPT5]|uniref:Secreted protein n=1 Tax=Plenodomus tracheiphilus IPT5 TaxID=1408161 RepID=A0A6A7BQD5_9PLEO|nr:hypothetical protein T440DRAFT_474180 [Plenodomus tracheiphilus IPT5]